jgi:MOSC domain-containing protein
MMTVASLWRYPVKSMQGERLDGAVLTLSGVVGDRAYAVVDDATGKVASAKHPRKWARLLDCAARFVTAPQAGDPPPPVRIALPGGDEVTSDDPAVDGRLTEVLGRPVRLVSVAPERPTLEEMWPDIDGLAPAEFIEATAVAGDEEDETVSDITMGLAAPPGTFFDLSSLHLITTSTLDRLTALAPDSRFDVRRYRPNVVVGTDDEGFVENAWPGRTVRIGDDAEAAVDLATMRCVMTTLAQDDLPNDRATLRAIARHNRIEIPGFGHWACAGVYARVTHAGAVRVGDEVAV